MKRPLRRPARLARGSRPSLLALAALLAAGALAACRTRIFVSPEPPPAPGGDAVVSGLPFRVGETHIVRVFQYHAATDPEGEAPGFVEVFETRMPLPVMDHTFVLDVASEAFSDRALKVQYLKDGTLHLVNLTATPQAQGLDALLSQTSTLADKILRLEDEQRKREEELRALETQRRTAAQADLEAVARYDAALQGVRAALATWRDAPSTQTSAAAHAALTALNAAAVAAGLPPPHPRPTHENLATLLGVYGLR
jgi:hypothetical protein